LIPLIATTYALNFGLDYVKDCYARQTKGLGDELSGKWVVILCCAIKPLVTWHAAELGTICRERCGGQGYLSVNRFSEGIGGNFIQQKLNFFYLKLN
jgi:acyl-CoA oxidase